MLRFVFVTILVSALTVPSALAQGIYTDFDQTSVSLGGGLAVFEQVTSLSTRVGISFGGHLDLGFNYARIQPRHLGYGKERNATGMDVAVYVHRKRERGDRIHGSGAAIQVAVESNEYATPVAAGLGFYYNPGVGTRYVVTPLVAAAVVFPQVGRSASIGPFSDPKFSTLVGAGFGLRFSHSHYVVATPAIGLSAGEPVASLSVELTSIIFGRYPYGP